MKIKKNIDNLNLEFSESLPIGKQKERVVFNYLINNDNIIEIIENDDSRFDQTVVCKNKKFKIEIKFDNMCLKTGNFAVECESMGKPSGIKTTQSDLWCFVDSENKMYFIKTSDLRKMCITKKPIQTRCEDSWNKVFLVKVSDFNILSINVNKYLDNEN